MAELKKGVSRFQFIGKVKLTDKTFSINQKSEKNPNFIFSKMDLGIDCGTQDSNIVFATLMGGYDTQKNSIIYCHGTKEENGKTIDDYEKQIQVSFDKRFEERTDIADSCYITIGIVKDVNDNTVEKNFLSAYDAIAYLKDNLKDDMIINVKGQLKYSSYNGKTKTDRVITSIWLSKLEQKDFKASFEQTVLFTQEGFTGALDDKGYFPLYGYVIDYYNKDIKNVCYPYIINIDTNKMPKYNIIINNYLRPTNPDDVYRVNLEGRLVKTDNTVEIKYEDLSEDLQTQVDLGMLTKEEALGRVVGSSRGESRITLKSICTKTDKETGVTELLVDKTNTKVVDIVKVPEKTEATESVVSAVGTEARNTEIEPVSDDVIKDLFGE